MTYAMFENADDSTKAPGGTVSYNFGLMIECLVAALLVLTILYCARLNKQIGQLKSDEKLMKASIVELVLATEKAERAIGGLKITAREADDTAWCPLARIRGLLHGHGRSPESRRRRAQPASQDRLCQQTSGR